MKKYLFLLPFLLLSSASASTALSSAQPMRIIAAENVYGNIAEQLGHPYVQVTSIINNPNQDPHLFSVSPQVAVLLNGATIIIENGLGDDDWMDRLYAASHTKALLINVGQSIGKKMGDNPHIWYDPKTMIVFSTILTKQLIQQDPQHEEAYQKNLTRFLKQAIRYQKRVKKLAQRVEGTKVTATEPVANYLLHALKLVIINKKFQQDMMNEVDLTPREIIAFEESLTTKNGPKLLIYNTQISSPITERLKSIAVNQHISVVGVSETMPNAISYYQWMNQILTAIEKGLT